MCLLFSLPMSTALLCLSCITLCMALLASFLVSSEARSWSAVALVSAISLLSMWFSVLTCFLLVELGLNTFALGHCISLRGQLHSYLNLLSRISWAMQRLCARMPSRRCSASAPSNISLSSWWRRGFLPLRTVNALSWSCCEVARSSSRAATSRPIGSGAGRRCRGQMQSIPFRLMQILLRAKAKDMLWHWRKCRSDRRVWVMYHSQGYDNAFFEQNRSHRVQLQYQKQIQVMTQWMQSWCWSCVVVRTAATRFLCQGRESTFKKSVCRIQLAMWVWRVRITNVFYYVRKMSIGPRSSCSCDQTKERVDGQFVLPI